MPSKSKKPSHAERTPGPIGAELEQAIAAELRVHPYGKRTAEKFKVDVAVVRRIAQREKIPFDLKGQRGKLIDLNEASPVAKERLARRSQKQRGGIEDELEVYRLLAAITGHISNRELDRRLGYNDDIIIRKLDFYERVSIRWVTDSFIPRLLEVYPHRSLEIAELERFLCQPRASAAKAKKDPKALQLEFRQVAGRMLREMREICGISLDDVRARTKSPIIQKNIERIETGDGALASSIYRQAITDLSPYYSRLKPEATRRELRELQRLQQQLKV